MYALVVGLLAFLQILLQASLKNLPQVAFFVLVATTTIFLPLECVVVHEKQLTPIELRAVNQRLPPSYHGRPPTTTLSMAFLLFAIGPQGPP